MILGWDESHVSSLRVFSNLSSVKFNLSPLDKRKLFENGYTTMRRFITNTTPMSAGRLNFPSLGYKNINVAPRDNSIPECVVFGNYGNIAASHAAILCLSARDDVVFPGTLWFSGTGFGSMTALASSSGCSASIIVTEILMNAINIPQVCDFPPTRMSTLLNFVNNMGLLNLSTRRQVLGRFIRTLGLSPNMTFREFVSGAPISSGDLVIMQEGDYLVAANIAGRAPLHGLKSLIKPPSRILVFKTEVVPVSSFPYNLYDYIEMIWRGFYNISFNAPKLIPSREIVLLEQCQNTLEFTFNYKRRAIDFIKTLYQLRGYHFKC